MIDDEEGEGQQGIYGYPPEHFDQFIADDDTNEWLKLSEKTQDISNMEKKSENPSTPCNFDASGVADAVANRIRMDIRNACEESARDNESIRDRINTAMWNVIFAVSCAVVATIFATVLGGCIWLSPKLDAIKKQVDQITPAETMKK